MAEKVKFGLSNVYVAIRKDTGDAITYEKPVAVPGAINASITRNSDQNILYADNKAYFVANKKSSQEVELELADIPEAILTSVLGYIKSTAGSLLETDAPVTPHFALMFQIETDSKARKIRYYNCTAVEADEEYATSEETIDPTTSTMNVTSTGEPIGDYNVFREIVYSGNTNYNDFFTTVTLPEAAELTGLSMDKSTKAVI